MSPYAIATWIAVLTWAVARIVRSKVRDPFLRGWCYGTEIGSLIACVAFALQVKS